MRVLGVCMCGRTGGGGFVTVALLLLGSLAGEINRTCGVKNALSNRPHHQHLSAVACSTVGYKSALYGATTPVRTGEYSSSLPSSCP